MQHHIYTTQPNLSLFLFCFYFWAIHCFVLFCFLIECLEQAIVPYLEFISLVFLSFFFLATNLKNGMQFYDHAIKLASNLNCYNFDPQNALDEISISLESYLEILHKKKRLLDYGYTSDSGILHNLNTNPFHLGEIRVTSLKLFQTVPLLNQTLRSREYRK